MAVTVMVKVCAALVLTFGATPDPLSLSVTVTVATPCAFGAGVYVKSPDALMVCCALNNAVLLLLTFLHAVFLIYSGSPLLIDVAQPATLWAPASSLTV